MRYPFHTTMLTFRCFHFTTSPPDGLPDLPESFWADYAAAPPAESPHMLLLASPPRDRAFTLEKWLGRLDTSLPWAKKVGGLTVGDGRLYVNGTQHDGGAVGLALCGVEVDALVCQGALPVGPAFEITDCEANIIRSLDGKSVHKALIETLQEVEGGGGGNLMAGIGVPMRPVVGGATPAADTSSESPYVVRAILGYSKQESALIVGANPELLPGARFQLHVFSGDNARSEMIFKAAALAQQQKQQGNAATTGGFMVSCLGRGPALYGEANVETTELDNALGPDLALAGFAAGGEIGPVGARTFVHTYTTTCGLLRARG